MSTSATPISLTSTLHSASALSSTSTPIGGLGSTSSGPGTGASDCQAGCCGSSQEFITKILQNSHSNTRGEVVGDVCLTILMDESVITSSTLLETDYTSTVTQKPIDGAIAIPSTILSNLKDEFDILEDIPDSDIIYGQEALNEGKKGGVHLIHPMKDLVRFLDEISLTTSPTNGPISLLCEETLALLIRHYAQKAINQTKQSSSTSQKKKRSGKRIENQITLVVPNYLGMKQRKRLLTASKSVGFEVRHIFSRGVATVAGNLFPAKSPLSEALAQWMSKFSNAEQDPLVLTVHSHSCGIDIALIRCERTRSPDSEANLMGFDRVIAIACGGGPYEGYGLGSSVGVDIKEKEKLINALIVEQLTSAGVTNASGIGAILYSGSGSIKDFIHCLQSQPTSNSLTNELAKLSILKSSEIDTVRGGSLLTAAELESAKYYIEHEDESSTIAYALSIGEEVVNFDVAYRLESSPTDVSEPILIVRKGTSVHKRYQGPVVKHRANTPNILVPPLVIEGGTVNVVGSFTPKYLPGYPKLVLLQKLPNYQNSRDEHWTELMPPVEVLKLSSRDDSSNTSVALKSTLTFSIAESSCTLKIDNSQEESAKEKSELRSQIFRVIFFICLIVFLVAGYYGYQEYHKYQTHQQNIQWLTDFYSQHAPQKLQEDGFIEKTLRKYEGKLFLLWRQLEKTYKVKFSPPTTILEQVDDEF